MLVPQNLAVMMGQEHQDGEEEEHHVGDIMAHTGSGQGMQKQEA